MLFITPFLRNFPKQRRIFNCCDEVDLQTLECGQELYTDPHGININQMMLIDKLMCIVTTGKEEKSNTYTYYKHAKEQSTLGGHYHQIIFIDQENCLFFVIKSSTSNAALFNRFINDRCNGVFIIGSLIAIFNPDPIEGYMNGVPIFFLNKQ